MGVRVTWAPHFDPGKVARAVPGSDRGKQLKQFARIGAVGIELALSTVIGWLATREWSTGAVGMYGTSYSGFNAIHLAIEGPSALKAVIPIFATDDRFGDDVHYFGGALKQLDLVDYPTYMIAMNALPPVPAIYGEGWREEWERRVAANEPGNAERDRGEPEHDQQPGMDHDAIRVGRVRHDLFHRFRQLLLGGLALVEGLGQMFGGQAEHLE